MEKTRVKIPRRKIKRRRKNKRRIYISILTKLILCIAVISAVFAIYNNNNKVQPVLENQISEENSKSEAVSENQTNEENNKVEPSENTLKIEGTKRFEGISLVNDNRGVPVICYHSVTEDQSKKGSIVIPKDKFREQLKTIKDNGYTTLTMSELKDYLFKDKPIPEKSVIITFDDGYRDNYTNAFPIIKELNMKVTIFVIASYINKELYLTGDQIKEMSDYGMDIESHTLSHKRLSALPYEEQLKELKKSKEAIEGITNKPVISIAYPEGIYNDNTKKAVVDSGYSMGFTIERGYADRNDNLAKLNRICIDYTYKPNNILNVLKNLKK